MWLDNDLRYIKKILIYDELASTNDHALFLEKEGEPSGTLIIARKQSQGRGRFKRSWLMGEGDIAMSLLIRSTLAPTFMSLLAWVPAVAVLDTMKELGIELKLKWPNDIVMRAEAGMNHSYCQAFAKVGGVLVENVIKDDMLATIIGLGLNIRPRPALVESVPHARWLSMLKPDLTDDEIWPLLLKKIDAHLCDLLDNAAYKHLHERYAQACISLGQQLCVESEGQLIKAWAYGLSEEGFLLVHDGQKEHSICSGEVNFCDDSI